MISPHGVLREAALFREVIERDRERRRLGRPDPAPAVRVAAYLPIQPVRALFAARRGYWQDLHRHGDRSDA